MKRICTILMMALMTFPVLLKAQSATDTVPYCCNFENQMEMAFWRFANTSSGNRWIINSATQNGVGINSMYISNDGISHNYSNTQSYSYAMRRLHIPAGVYEVTYDWVANGYSSATYAYLRVFLIPATATFAGGQQYAGLSATTLPTGAISLDRGNALLLQSSWTTFNDPIVQVPTTNDYFLVFFWYNNTSVGTSYQPPAAIDNICIQPVTCPKPMQLQKTDLGNGCIAINWTDYGNPRPTGWIIEYGQRGFIRGHGTTLYTNSKPDTICGLTEDVTYEFVVRAICDTNDTSNYSDPITVRYCSGIRCIDFTNLRSATCTYGTYSNYQQYSGSYLGPYANRGVIDLGSGSYGRSSNAPGSRHTVNTDPGARDPVFPQISKIPPDECESVRLGSLYGGYICQSVSYQMTVDTTVADILLFKYACVFNDVGHGATQQPRFVLEILDRQNNLISPTCGAADFNATDVTAGNIGGTWYSRTGSISYIDTIVDSNTGAINCSTMTFSTYSNGLRGRDWTPMGLNISQYHGQNITIRVTSFNCGQSGPNHCGYVYYTLGCSKARIVANTCGNNAQVATLTAPSGFLYRWYNHSLPNWSSNQQTVQVNIDSSVYYCEVSFIDDTSCKFTMSTMASPRFPHANFTASLDTTGCNYTVIVTNRSYASISAYDTNAIGPCESFYWDWGDGSPITRSEHPGSHTYRRPGTYTIRLVVGLAGDECSDTIYRTVTFNAPEAPTISGDSVVCVNTRAHIQVNGPTARRWQWSNGQTTSGIDIYPPDSVTMTVHVWDQLGCETVLDFHVDVDTVPLPIFDPQVYESCVPYTMSIVDINPESQRNTYSWNWGDGSTTPNTNNPTHTYSAEGTYRFTCFIKSAEGCLDTVYNTAYVFSFPHGSFSWTPPIITVTNPEIQFINLTTPNPTNVYDWEVFYHTSNPATYPNTFEPTHRWTGSTTDYSGSNLVRLITTNQVQTPSGNVVACLDTVENTVLIINDLLQFPNTITPNGDGINDIFEIKNLIEGGGFTDNELYVYNHWGRKVYHKKNITTREDFWDPSLNNDPDGTYYYRFSAKGYLGDILRNGTITVVR